MKPVIALVGRPNVGKSTLFNRLTRRRDAIVLDVPGVTRDRHYGDGAVGGRAFVVVDTGGLQPEPAQALYAETERQTEQAIVEADAVIFVTDARAGLAPGDRAIAERLRRLKPKSRVRVAANKAEGMAPEGAAAEFHELGLGAPLAISAAHGQGVQDLLDSVLRDFPGAEDEGEPEADKHPRIAFVGRPNVGKSTLVNALVGEERVVAFSEPGTTRDAIEVPFERAGRRYTLVDTAGLRKRGRAGEEVERFSIVKTLQAIDAANVAVLVLDALEGISEQDAHVAGYILERGRAVVVVVNKWDAADKEARARLKAELGWKLGFLGFAQTLFVSAKQGRGVAEVMRAVDAAYAAAMAKLATPKLTRALIAAVERQQPARRGYSRPKLRYAHQGGSNPPRIVIHGNALEHVSAAYLRYLEGWFRDAFKLSGTPLRIELRTGRNPYAQGKSRR
ncbi:MAG TPA: ribosome biogenesis GTPase Der [Burkholderiales bacterium]|nr:ribosome biogenesis GTPase Der [Burkholderiales bacterium]